MKCPKCGYTSFPYVESCANCGQGLTEQRAAFGLYAIRPEPLDLLRAYAAEQIDSGGTALTPALAAPGIDLSPLHEIELELAEAEETATAMEGKQEHTAPTADLTPTMPQASDADFGPLGLESDAERTNRPEVATPPTVDLREMEEITLELESATDLGLASPDNPQTQTESPPVNQVYDLDLEEGLEGLTLGSTVDESRSDESEAGTVEYTLEIDEELELEIHELELEEDDQSESADDDDR